MAASLRRSAVNFKRGCRHQALPYQGEATGSPSGRCFQFTTFSSCVWFVRNPTDPRLSNAAESGLPTHKESQMSETSGVVLLIHPDDNSRAVYADALRNAGFTVVMAPDCAAGLYAISEVTPQIVVASFDRHTHDECLVFCERLKGDSRTRAIPILLTSETIDGADLQRATDMKVLGIAIGPHDEAKITGAVRGVLAVADGRASMSQPERRISRSA